jgi:hypothetical protein
MGELLELEALERRVEGFSELLVFREGLALPTKELLRDVFLRGEVERGDVPRITGMSERSARLLLSELTARRLLVSSTPKGPVRLGFPLAAVGYYFPRLYPEGVEQSFVAGLARRRPKA